MFSNSIFHTKIMRKNANNHRNMKTLPAFNSAIHNSLITSIILLTNAGKKNARFIVKMLWVAWSLFGLFLFIAWLACYKLMMMMVAIKVRPHQFSCFLLNYAETLSAVCRPITRHETIKLVDLFKFARALNIACI